MAFAVGVSWRRIPVTVGRPTLRLQKSDDLHVLVTGVARQAETDPGQKAGEKQEQCVGVEGQIQKSGNLTFFQFLGEVLLVERFSLCVGEGFLEDRLEFGPTLRALPGALLWGEREPGGSVGLYLAL